MNLYFRFPKQKALADTMQRAEAWALAGLLQEVQELFTQVWAISQQYGLDGSNGGRLAGCLLVQMGKPSEAAAWFERVTTLPNNQARWPANRQALIQMCRMIAVCPQTLAAGSFATDSQPCASAELPPLKIRNLGSFQVQRSGVALPVCRARKSVALLRYLLTRRERQAFKEELMELLWPSSSPQEATHSLHVAVNTLRRYLDPPHGTYLLFEAGAYSFHPMANIEDDCAVFERLYREAERSWRAHDLLVAEQTFNRAIALYQGHYHVDIHDGVWAITERERLLSQFLSALACWPLPFRHYQLAG